MAANNSSYNKFINPLKVQSQPSRVPLQTLNSSQTKPITTPAMVEAPRELVPEPAQTLFQDPVLPWFLEPNPLPPSSPIANLEGQPHHGSELQHSSQNPSSSQDIHNSSSSLPTTVHTSDSAIEPPAAQEGEASSSVQTAEADPIQAKKEEVEVSLSKKTDAEIQQKPLKPHHRLALAAYATSRAVLPTQQSRRTWSNKNNVSEGLVTDFLNEIVRKNRKEKNGTNDKWKIPKELVTPDDPRFHSTEAKDSSTETKDEGPAEPPAGLDHPNSDPVQAPPSPQQTVQEKPRSSPAPAPASAPDVPMNDTNANHNPVPTSSMNTGNQADIPQQTSMAQGDLTQAQNPSDPVQINFPPDMTQEIYELLVQHRFFTLVEGPFGVTFEDMLNWPAFEAKLRLHECSLRPRFVWRLLKMFYFFF